MPLSSTEIARLFLYPQPEDALCRGDWDPPTPGITTATSFPSPRLAVVMLTQMNKE
ncbi:hypothetical protein ALC56_06210 [Trachymyrmex septentrionalis]|uniref:Uncharacterized protein n=1 Tax=Trachymyrmex septentrionalis TaxID=34720 RepID=A0A151JX35_9HYME|nr:hypothetical protein ALC56_06210 [Trachymyrmex septentrionalis]